MLLNIKDPLISRILKKKVNFRNVNSVIILGLSYAISTLQAHLSQRRFVWNSHAGYPLELFKFSTYYLLHFLLNLVLLFIMNSMMTFSREVNQILIVCTLTIVFFFVNKNGVFNGRSRQNQHKSLLAT